MIRLGLCCQFLEAPIKFRTTTAKSVLKLPKPKQQARLAEICHHNAMSLSQAIEYCSDNGIGSFRVNSQILPLKTHPDCGYELFDLPDGPSIQQAFCKCRELATKNNFRLTFHPDQFVVINSPREEVVASSIAELEYQSEVAEWIGADCVNIHAGGAYGNKQASLQRFGINLSKLSNRVRDRLTVENDDRLYTPSDLLPLCQAEGVPLVYDVHHHRCNPDDLTIEQATIRASKTWNREPLFHISSPRDDWKAANPRPHHDFINLRDFPHEWDGLDATVEVEAKAKEVAIKKLQTSLRRRKRANNNKAV